MGKFPEKPRCFFQTLILYKPAHNTHFRYTCAKIVGQWHEVILYNFIKDNRQSHRLSWERDWKQDL